LYNVLSIFSEKIPQYKAYPKAVVIKEVLQKEKEKDVVFAIYIWPLYIYGAEPATHSASSIKIWHPPKTGREKGSEKGRGRGKEWGSRKPEG
jgi:hypothetical protein